MSTLTEQEFASLSARIRSKLTALARRFNRAAGIAGEAEDVAQEALIILWQLSEKGYPVRDAEALAVKITKNLCISRYRKQHLQFQSMTDAAVAGGESATSAADTADIETIRDTLYRRLTETQRTFLTLRNEYGLSLDEIAATTGRPKASIKVSISTARRQMLEQLKKIQ
jgi:RNA polymerase sigma-70 factor (ECF subfamily)